jgi:hypothetical protein
MVSPKVVLSIVTVFLLVSLLGVSYAENQAVNGTNNTSEPGNISVLETNQSDPDHTGNNTAHKILISDSVVSTGGIKIFMKDFKYKSGV